LTPVTIVQEQRRTHIRALNAVAHFSSSRFDDAINTFIELDVNPAKVVALYPETISGRLSRPRHDWIPLFGGPGTVEESASVPPVEAANDVPHEKPEKHVTDLPASSTGTLRGRPKTASGVSQHPRSKDDDTSSLSDKPKAAVHGKSPLKNPDTSFD
jgi:hypothetical protein